MHRISSQNLHRSFLLSHQAALLTPTRGRAEVLQVRAAPDRLLALEETHRFRAGIQHLILTHLGQTWTNWADVAEIGWRMWDDG